MRVTQEWGLTVRAQDPPDYAAAKMQKSCQEDPSTAWRSTTTGDCVASVVPSLRSRRLSHEDVFLRVTRGLLGTTSLTAELPQAEGVTLVASSLDAVAAVMQVTQRISRDLAVISP